MGDISNGGFACCCNTFVCLDWSYRTKLLVRHATKTKQELRQQYGLPYQPAITDPKMLQTPPSERGLPGYNTNPQ